MKTFALLCVILAAGCSDNDDTTTTPGADTGAVAADTGGGGGDDTGPADAVAADDVAAEAARPATPEVVSVMPMAGDWHVTWKVNDTALNKVELWRSDDGATPALVKAFPCTATCPRELHDSGAKGTVVKYCYTVRTFRGTLESATSAEKCSK